MELKTFDDARREIAAIDDEKWHPRHPPGMPTVRHTLLHLLRAMRTNQMMLICDNNVVFGEMAARCMEFALRLERASGRQLSDEREWLASIFDANPGILGPHGGGHLLWDHMQKPPYYAVHLRLGPTLWILANVCHDWEDDGPEPTDRWPEQVLACADQLRDAAFLFGGATLRGNMPRNARLCARSAELDAAVITELLYPLGQRLEVLKTRELTSR